MCLCPKDETRKFCPCIEHILTELFSIVNRKVEYYRNFGKAKEQTFLPAPHQPARGITIFIEPAKGLIQYSKWCTIIFDFAFAFL